MKIKSYKIFQEALKDEILPIQAHEVGKKYGKKFLEYEPVEKNKTIVEGKWELTEEDKMRVIGRFFSTDITELKNSLSELPDSLSLAIKNATIRKFRKLYEGLDIHKPTLRQITTLYSNCLYQINARETDSTKKMLRDELNRPIMGDDNKPTFQEKEKGEIVYTNNIVNINGFIESWNKAFKDNQVDEEVFKSHTVNSLNSTVSENPKIVDFNIFSDEPMYLYISSKPKDVLNMSMSMFYTSCQNLYIGSHRDQLLMNVFDKNTKPAFLIFDTPYYASDLELDDYKNLKGKMLSEFTAMSRMLLRATSGRGRIFLDRAYPDRLQHVFEDIVKKYTEMRTTTDHESTEFTLEVDLPEQHGLDTPYQDRFDEVNFTQIIGKNVKEISAGKISDLVDRGRISHVKISEDNIVDTIVIGSRSMLEAIEEILKDQTKMELILEKFKHINCIKLKGIDLSDYDNYNNFIMPLKGTLKIDNCKILLGKLNIENAEEVHNLEIISSYIYGSITGRKDNNDNTSIMPDISIFKNVVNLKCIYTFKKLHTSLLDLKSLKKLTLSEEGLFSSKNQEQSDFNKEIIEKLKEKGVKIQYESL